MSTVGVCGCVQCEWLRVDVCVGVGGGGASVRVAAIGMSSAALGYAVWCMMIRPAAERFAAAAVSSASAAAATAATRTVASKARLAMARRTGVPRA